MTRLSEDDIALAGEYALGLLEAAEEATASARVATDAEFAAEVEAWRVRLQPLLDGADEQAPDALWSRIEGRLPALVQDRGTSALPWWQAGAFVSTAIAAGLAAVLVLQPAPPPPDPAAAPMVAALSGDTGASLAMQYDARSGQLLVMPVRLDTGARVPELWVVPEDGKARSLGVVRADGPSRVTIPEALRPHMHGGVTLAITPEPPGGAPGGTATGPIIASGTIVSA